MDNDIKSLNPQAVWKRFAEICAIPHTSGKEEKIREYIIDIARSKNLNYRTDANGNLLIEKRASKGKEQLKCVILQAHLDMVWQKMDGDVFGQEDDPVEAIIDNGWVRADKTSLGADNGIGVAAALAILESEDIEHGPLEFLFTVNDENCHTGAYGLGNDFLSGDILINLDMKHEGELCVGCAGGVEMTATFKYTEDRNKYREYEAIRIDIMGLKGGHSGYSIGLQRANAIKILFRFLYLAMKHFDLKIGFVDGGGVQNAIPREATAVVCVPREMTEDFLYGLEQFENIIVKEYEGIEENISIKGCSCDIPESTWDKRTMSHVIYAVCGCPNGVIKMSPDTPALVQTSSNLSSIFSYNSQIVVQSLLRSSSDSEREALVNAMSSVFELAGAKVYLDNAYDGWSHDPDSEIYKIMDSVYMELFGHSPQASRIHAGLECAIIGRKYPKMDIISCGPTIKEAHSPYEKVKIDSVFKFWELLKNTLSKIPSK